MTIGALISEYRKQHDMSMAEFGRACNLSRAYISLLEKNEHPKTGKPIVPTAKVYQQIASAMHISIEELFARINDSPLIVKQHTKPLVIPVLGRVAAGIPISAITDIIDTEEITEELARTGEFFGLKIKGDSMEPRIYNNDVVIVRQQEDAESGDIVIAMVNGDDAVCKRLIKYDSSIALMSLNSKYEPLIFTNEEIKQKPVRILGKVVELRSKF